MIMIDLEKDRYFKNYGHTSEMQQLAFKIIKTYIHVALKTINFKINKYIDETK